MTLQLFDVPTISVGDVDFGAIDFTRYLDSGETLTGTPTVAEITTTDLTISSVAVNVAALIIKSRTVAIGKALQFKVQGQQAGVAYSLLVTVTTSASRTKKVVARFRTAE